MGTPDELHELVDAAHAQGIRILFDVVMNHPATSTCAPPPTAAPRAVARHETATLRDYHRFIDYNSFAFADWWGRDWVRAGLPGYLDGGRDDLTMQLAFLPDFRTESTQPVRLPKFLRDKPGTARVDLPDTTVRGYLVHVARDWVREYGIDGFRADTVKHVEPAAWRAEATSHARAGRWKARTRRRRSTTSRSGWSASTGATAPGATRCTTPASTR
jgi:alpha-amylase